jgi:hypothetical protein
MFHVEHISKFRLSPTRRMHFTGNPKCSHVEHSTPAFTKNSQQRIPTHRSRAFYKQTLGRSRESRFAHGRRNALKRCEERDAVPAPESLSLRGEVFKFPSGKKKCSTWNKFSGTQEDFLEGGQAFNIKLIGSTGSISGASDSARGVARAGHCRDVGFARAHVVEKKLSVPRGTFVEMAVENTANRF